MSNDSKKLGPSIHHLLGTLRAQGLGRVGGAGCITAWWWKSQVAGFIASLALMEAQNYDCSPFP